MTAAFDIEGWLAARIADKFARCRGGGFINGDGVDKPTGILTTPRWTTTFGHGATLAMCRRCCGDSTAAEAIIDLVYALGAQYRANATL